jgi:hypothetical protein
LGVDAKHALLAGSSKLESKAQYSTALYAAAANLYFPGMAKRFQWLCSGDMFP